MPGSDRILSNDGSMLRTKKSGVSLLLNDATLAFGIVTSRCRILCAWRHRLEREFCLQVENGVKRAYRLLTCIALVFIFRLISVCLFRAHEVDHELDLVWLQEQYCNS